MAGLDTLFAQNVVEVVARRRGPVPPRMGTFRRFLCTNSYPLLNSVPGKTAFHYKPPTHPPPYNARARNLITVFDLFMQEYRNINLDDYQIQATMPVRNVQEIMIFWEFFDKVLKKMSKQRKINYMRPSTK